MDSLTHIALGALVGEAYAGKALSRNKAMLIGAAAQSFPDIDFVLGFFNSPVDDLLAHRGITHSIFFSILATLALAYMMKRFIQAEEGFTLRHWIIFIGMEIVLHLTLDCLNAYGTGLFEPFTNHRISFNVIFVADPLFTLWLAAAMLVLFFLRKENIHRLKIVRTAIIISGCYLFICFVNKSIVDNRAQKSFATAGITPKQYFTSPTPLNTLLWYVVVEGDSGFYIGYSSVLDKQKNISFDFYPQNNFLLTDIKNQDEVETLKLFSQGFYTIERIDNALVFNDLRFGQIGGWHTQHAPFVFYFYLDKPDMNTLVIQRGRFTGWNKETLVSYWRRMLGLRD